MKVGFAAPARRGNNIGNRAYETSSGTWRAGKNRPRISLQSASRVVPDIYQQQTGKTATPLVFRTALRSARSGSRRDGKGARADREGTQTVVRPEVSGVRQSAIDPA